MWREFRSEHFVVCSDADGKEVRESMADFETTYRALTAVLFHEDGEVPEPMRVVLFAHHADLRKFVPSAASAAFSPAKPGDPASMPTLLVETPISENARRVFVHELTHAFVDRWFGRVPIWLDEGLAQYFETMRLEKGRIVLGEPATSATLGFHATQLPRLTALITADRPTFYAGSYAHTVESLYQQGSYYVAAWGLVRLLMQDNGDYHRRFFQYLDALTRRVPHQAAWVRSFDGATFRRLAHDYAEYFRSELETGAVSIEVRPAADVVRQERIMQAEETQSLWTQLAPATNR